MGKTSIEWAEYTWNPVTGCDKVSPGCDNCYAEGIAHRFAGTSQFPNGFGVTLRPERLGEPLRWRKPRRVFVNSMSDLFHADVPDEFIAKVFATMARAPQHAFQILTKRPGRMRSLIGDGAQKLLEATTDEETAAAIYDAPWPLPNVWLGVSAEDQKWANVRIPVLLDTPAAVRFISAEPLLGPIELNTRWLAPTISCARWKPGHRPDASDRAALAEISRAATRMMATSRGEAPPAYLDWVIVGGESGRDARPMHTDWARSLRNQCERADVAFHFKQHGEWIGGHQHGDPWSWTEPDGWVSPKNGRVAAEDDARSEGGSWLAMWRVGKKAAGRVLDGRTWDEYPKEADRG